MEITWEEAFMRNGVVPDGLEEERHAWARTTLPPPADIGGHGHGRDLAGWLVGKKHSIVVVVGVWRCGPPRATIIASIQGLPPNNFPNKFPSRLFLHLMEFLDVLGNAIELKLGFILGPLRANRLKHTGCAHQK